MRIVLSVLAVLITLGTFFLARQQLAILSFSASASAIQVSQVHAEAQTIIQFGILSLLLVLVLALLFPASATQSATSKQSSFLQERHVEPLPGAEEE